MLQSLSLRYDPTEDRMLLHLHVQQPPGPVVVHPLHLTRRLCAQWRQDLQAMVDRSAQAPERMDPAARAAASKAHHDAQSSQARVSTDRPSSELPQPERPPMLVTRIACGQRQSDRRWVVQFETASMPPMTLVLTSQTLHALVDALSRRVQTAQWALPAVASEQRAPAPAAASSHMH